MRSPIRGDEMYIENLNRACAAEKRNIYMYMYIGGSWGKGRPTKKTVRLVSLRIKVTVQGILRYRFAKIPSYPLLRTAPPLSSSSRISRSDRRPTSRSPTSRLRNPSEPTYIHIHAYIHTLFSPHTEPRSMRVVTYIRPSVHNLLLSRAHLLLPSRHSRLTGSAADTRAPIYLRTKGTNSGTGTHVRGAFSRERRQHANVEDREREREREMPSRLIPWTGRGQVSVRPCRPDRMLLPPHRLRVHHGSSLDRGIVGCTQVCTRWAGRAFLRRCRVSYIHRKAPTSSKNERERGRDGKGYSRQGRGKGGGEEKEEGAKREREFLRGPRTSLSAFSWRQSSLFERATAAPLSPCASRPAPESFSRLVASAPAPASSSSSSFSSPYPARISNGESLDARIPDHRRHTTASTLLSSLIVHSIQDSFKTQFFPSFFLSPFS